MPNGPKNLNGSPWKLHKSFKFSNSLTAWIAIISTVLIFVAGGTIAFSKDYGSLGTKVVTNTENAKLLKKRVKKLETDIPKQFKALEKEMKTELERQTDRIIKLLER